jgi:hypothetical protein
VFGATVHLLDENDKPIKYQIVGQTEADAKVGRISYSIAARPRADRPQRRRRGRVLGAVGRQILFDREGRVHLSGRSARRLTLAPARATLAIAGVTARRLGLSLSRAGWIARRAIWAGFIPAVLGLDFGFFLAPVLPDAAHGDLGARRLCTSLFNLLILCFCGRAVEGDRSARPSLSSSTSWAPMPPRRAISRSDPGRPDPMIGASGAISAVIGAYAMLFGKNRVKVRQPAAGLVAQRLWLAAWVVLQLAMGFLRARGGHHRRRRPYRRVSSRAAARQAAAAAGATARPELQPSALPRPVRLEQAVEVDDDIFHLGIVDRALGVGAPGVERARHNRGRGRPGRSRRSGRLTKSRPCGSLDARRRKRDASLLMRARGGWPGTRPRARRRPRNRRQARRPGSG